MQCLLLLGILKRFKPLFYYKYCILNLLVGGYVTVGGLTTATEIEMNSKSILSFKYLIPLFYAYMYITILDLTCGRFAIQHNL